MDIILPILKLQLNFFSPVLIGFIGGLLTGTIGIGGSIFVTPALMACGIPPLASVACQVNSTVGVALAGFLKYRRNHDVDMKLGWILVIGGVIGAYGGVKFLDLLPSASAVNLFIKAGYIMISFLMGTLFLSQSLKHIKRLRHQNPSMTPAPPPWVRKLPWLTSFRRTRVEISGVLLVIIGILGGFITATLGMGNGIFMMPVLTYIIGRTSPVVYGTTLFATVASATAATLGHALETQSIDLILVGLLVSGGVLGNRLGVRLGYLVPRAYLGFIGSLFIYAIGAKFAYALISPAFKLDLASVIDDIPPFMAQLNFFAQKFPYYHALSGIVMVVGIAFIVESMIKKSRKIFIH
ncbi:MAG TPA: sulfite exporter TauE/SafE family protein [Candidatus Nitrosotenuis sp.]|jgi:uncharacterized membrane protein YfcA|nr:sulfite exporter TauE/SafE family protein [Candidatus Nitrosotenuis sp.]